VTYDTTPLERDCVILNCSLPAVDPGRNRVHCAKHDPDPPKPRLVIGQDPDTQEPLPEPPQGPPNAPEGPLGYPDTQRPDLDSLEPVWDGTQYVLRPKQTGITPADRTTLATLADHLRTATLIIEQLLR
jgi:hypothetical protein